MRVRRFQVMAVLQAARAYVLGKPIETAKSFGLNRAIFYAAAKRGFKPKPTPPKELRVKEIRVPEKRRKEIIETFKIDHLGDEMAYAVEMNGKQYYMIGNEVQTEESFRKQIESRFQDKFEKAWKEAVEICKSYDRGVLLSQRAFYEVVYKPRRDELAEKWSKLIEG